MEIRFSFKSVVGITRKRQTLPKEQWLLMTTQQFKMCVRDLMPEVFRQNPFVIKDLDDFDIESATNLAELLNKVVSVVELNVQIIGAAPVKPKRKAHPSDINQEESHAVEKAKCLRRVPAFQVK